MPAGFPAHGAVRRSGRNAAARCLGRAVTEERAFHHCRDHCWHWGREQQGLRIDDPACHARGAAEQPALRRLLRGLATPAAGADAATSAFAKFGRPFDAVAPDAAASASLRAARSQPKLATQHEALDNRASGPPASRRVAPRKRLVAPSAPRRHGPVHGPRSWKAASAPHSGISPHRPPQTERRRPRRPYLGRGDPG